MEHSMKKTGAMAGDENSKGIAVLVYAVRK